MFARYMLKGQPINRSAFGGKRVRDSPFLMKLLYEIYIEVVCMSIAQINHKMRNFSCIFDRSDVCVCCLTIICGLTNMSSLTSTENSYDACRECCFHFGNFPRSRSDVIDTETCEQRENEGINEKNVFRFEITSEF